MQTIAAVSILVFVEGTRYFKRSFLIRNAKALFFATALLIFARLSFLTNRQFEIWQDDPLSKYLLPPYSPLNYLLLRSGFIFFFPYLLSLATALIFIFWMRHANQKHGGKFFEDEEPYLAGLGIFLSGHPGWLVYLTILIFFYSSLHLVRRLKGGKNIRISLYHLWIPAALFVILVNEFWLSRAFWWGLLKM
jgi:hypothetical protein